MIFNIQRYKINFFGTIKTAFFDFFGTIKTAFFDFFGTIKTVFFDFFGTIGANLLETESAGYAGVGDINAHIISFDSGNGLGKRGSSHKRRDANR